MARRRAGRQRGSAETKPNGGATIGHEAELWAMADALRGSMDAAEYKHVVLEVIFLKYISDAFEERHAAALAEFGEDAAEGRDQYTAENIFWVRPDARWGHLRAQSYSLSQFASAEGKKGGESCTPRCVVKVLVEMLEPFRGRVYDSCCGSSGMFVQSTEFICAHASGYGNGGRADGDISICGQESNYARWHLAGEDEPRHPGHRGTDRPRRQLPQRSPRGPEGGLNRRPQAGPDGRPHATRADRRRHRPYRRDLPSGHACTATVATSSSKAVTQPAVRTTRDIRRRTVLSDSARPTESRGRIPAQRFTGRQGAGIRGSVMADTDVRLLIRLRGDSRRNLETAFRRRQPCA